MAAHEAEGSDEDEAMAGNENVSLQGAEGGSGSTGVTKKGKPQRRSKGAKSQRQRQDEEQLARRGSACRRVRYCPSGCESEPECARASEARRIEAEVLPAAERTVVLVREGFNRGGFSYIDVIEAQKVLIDARSRRLDALKAFHTNIALLARLTGRHAALIPNSETVR